MKKFEYVKLLLIPLYFDINYQPLFGQIPIPISISMKDSLSISMSEYNNDLMTSKMDFSDGVCESYDDADDYNPIIDIDDNVILFVSETDMIESNTPNLNDSVLKVFGRRLWGM